MDEELAIGRAMQAVVEFRDARDWAQFHDPKNLAAALGIEAAELNEVFLWKTTEGSREVDVARVREELADVFAYALLLAHTFGLNPEEIVLEKVAKNAEKYPVERSRGVATKYTDL
jgi:NTP pyrophosphatase (non-canonical NTP hydrolase)